MKTILKNAIRTVKATDSSWLKESMNRDLCLNFENNGKDLSLSLNQGQIGLRFNEGCAIASFENACEDYCIYNKTTLLNYLREFIKEYKTK